MSNENEVGENVYKDLIGFLDANRSDLRTAATEAVIAVVDRDGMTNLIRHGVVKPLCKLASRESDDTNDQSNTNALTALLHLSSNGPSAPQCVEDIMDAGGVQRMTEIALSSSRSPSDNDGWRKRVNLSLALLANMTRTERGAVEFVGRSVPDEAIPTSKKIEDGEGEKKLSIPSRPTLPLLLSRFLSDTYVVANKEDEEKEEDKEEKKNDDENGDDPYQHFAAVLMNASQIEAGRKFIMRLNQEQKLTSSVLQKILPQLCSPNPTRRRGISGTIKNCCFDTDSSWWLLNEVNIAKYICYPLAGPEELDVDDKKGLDPDLWLEGPDKVREPDKMARLFLVESILLLCASGRKSREVLRKQKIYVILKMTDMVEESEDVSDRINECVQFLRRDEEGTEEGSSDLVAQEAFYGEGQRLALPAPSASTEVGVDNPEKDYDDVD